MYRIVVRIANPVKKDTNTTTVKSKITKDHIPQSMDLSVENFLRTFDNILNDEPKPAFKNNTNRPIPPMSTKEKINSETKYKESPNSMVNRHITEEIAEPIFNMALSGEDMAILIMIFDTIRRLLDGEDVKKKIAFLFPHLLDTMNNMLKQI